MMGEEIKEMFGMADDELTFRIEGKDLKNLKKFKKQHKKCTQGMTGEQFEYSFVPTGMGMLTTVSCSCGQELTLGNFMDHDAGEYDEEKHRVLTEEDHKNKQFEDAVQYILLMKNPKFFRRWFATDQTFDLVYFSTAATARFTDKRVGKCFLSKYTQEKNGNLINNYKGLTEQEKLKRFFEYFDEHVKAELDAYGCKDEKLYQMIDEQFDYEKIANDKDSLARWLCTHTKNGYGLFSRDVWMSEELLPILEKYVEEN